MRRRLAYLLILAGVAVLATIPLGVLRSDWQAKQAQARLASQFKTARACLHMSVPDHACAPRGVGLRAAEATPPSGKTPTTPPSEKSSSDVVLAKLPPLAAQPLPGGVLDRLEIPAIGLSRYVVQGTAEEDLDQGPGHYLGTPLPGEYGNVAIAGHRTTYGAPFWDLNELTSGDRVLLTSTTGQTWTYVVIGHMVVRPSDTSVVGRLKGYYLTLTTCNPRFWATSRLVVRAELDTTAR